MNQRVSNQGWEELQDHIRGFLAQALRSDVQSIEYKPRFSNQLLEILPEHDQCEARETGM